ncbi:MAG: ABC transporter permease [Verrucomicrobiae bacterium]|nr:ABC transporter permease [Verrucomicrobiae bacterium]
MNDLKFALRQLLKNPGFNAVAVLTLALGIGANTAIFSVVNAVLLKPLPYPQPGQLVTIRKELPPAGGLVLGGGNLVGGHEFAAWRKQSQTLSQIAAYGSSDRSLTGNGLAERIRCGTVTASLFPMLGVQPLLGRLFVLEDETPNGPRIAVLSHGLWQRQFGGDSGVLNRSITLDRELHTIVGVLPASFQFPDPNEVWVPMQAVRGPEVAGGAIAISLVHAMARLKPDVSLAQAQAELQLIASRVTLPMFQPPSDNATAPLILPPPDGGQIPIPDGLVPPPTGAGPVTLPFPGEGRMVLRGPPGAELGTPADQVQPVPLAGDPLQVAPAPPAELGRLPIGGGRIQLIGLHEHLVANVRRSVLVMMWAVALVLLIACANVANLLLTRAMSRRREIAVRLALGAPRARLIRQFLTESMLLAFVGGGLGLLCSWWGTRLLESLALTGRSHFQPVGIDLTALGFTLLTALATGMIFGLIPAVQAAGLPVNEALKEGGLTAGEGHDRHRLRGLLVTAETALALVLLVGAGLLINSFIRLRSVNVGFQPDGLLTFQLSLDASLQSEPGARSAFVRTLREELAALPGVESIAMTDHLPLTHFSMMTEVSVAGEPRERYANRPPVSLAAVTDTYFDTLGIVLKEGRAFTAADPSQRNVVVNERFAREYFPGASPVGRLLNDFAGVAGPHTIIGVVADVRQDGYGGQVTPEIYTPSLDQHPNLVSTAMRCAGDPLALARAVRERVQALDPTLVVADLMTMRERLDATTTSRRAQLLLLGGFSALALLLAAIGVYGVMSFIVTQRTREIGVRLTLGAPAADVTAMVLSQGMRFVAAGMIVGLVVAFLTTRAMTSMLFGIAATDPLTLMAVSLVLVGVGALACWLPARRAARVDPMVALRAE